MNVLFLTGLVLVALVGPVWFGGATPAGAAVLGVLAAGVGVVAVGRWWQAGRPAGAWPVGWLALVVVPLLGGAATLVPLPAAWPTWGGLAHPLWGEAAALAGAQTLYIGLAPLAGWGSLLNVLGAVVCTAAAYGYVRLNRSEATPDAGARHLLVALATLAFGVCLYGLVVFSLGNQQVLWLGKDFYPDSLSATFINRNTLATFAAVGVLLNVGLALVRVGEVASAGRATLRQRLKMAVALVLKPGWPWLLAAAVCAAALMLSASRAGLVWGAVGVVVLLGVVAWRAQGARVVLVPLMAGLALFGAVAFSLLGAQTSSRLAEVESEARMRGSIYHVSIAATQGSPWLGHGLGSFEGVFRFQPNETPSGNLTNRVDKAHNTWLELAVLLGWPLAVLVAGAALALLYTFARGAAVRRRGFVYPAVGLATGLVVVGHGLVDFSLQLPGFLSFMAVLVGALLAASQPGRPEQPRAWPRALALPLSAALGLGLLGLGWAHAHQLQLARQAEQPMAVVAAVQNGQTLATPQLADARAALAALSGRWPGASAGQALLETVLAARAGGPQTAAGLVLLHSARRSQKQALAEAPADPYGWYRLALVGRALGLEFAPAAVQSVLTGPVIRPLALERIPLLASAWPHLTDAADRALVLAGVAQQWQQRPWAVWRLVRQQPLSRALLTEAVAPLLNDPAAAEARARWEKITRTPWPTQGPPVPAAAQQAGSAP